MRCIWRLRLYGECGRIKVMKVPIAVDLLMFCTLLGVTAINSIISGSESPVRGGRHVMPRAPERSPEEIRRTGSIQLAICIVGVVLGGGLLYWNYYYGDYDD